VVLWYLEMKKKHSGADGQIIRLPWLEGSLVILGYGAIIVNVLFLLICMIFGAFKVQMKVPKWIIIFNLIVFCCQVYFHFFYKQSL